jgi:hypothetical protein
LIVAGQPVKPLRRLTGAANSDGSFLGQSAVTIVISENRDRFLSMFSERGLDDAAAPPHLPFAKGSAIRPSPYWLGLAHKANPLLHFLKASIDRSLVGDRNNDCVCLGRLAIINSESFGQLFLDILHYAENFACSAPSTLNTTSYVSI